MASTDFWETESEYEPDYDADPGPDFEECVECGALVDEVCDCCPFYCEECCENQYSGPSDYQERMAERRQMGYCNF